MMIDFKQWWLGRCYRGGSGGGSGGGGGRRRVRCRVRCVRRRRGPSTINIQRTVVFMHGV